MIKCSEVQSDVAPLQSRRRRTDDEEVDEGTEGNSREAEADPWKNTPTTGKPSSGGGGQ